MDFMIAIGNRLWKGKRGACNLMIKALIRGIQNLVCLILISFITEDLWHLWTAEAPLMKKWEKSDMIVKKEYGYDKEK